MSLVALGLAGAGFGALFGGIGTWQQGQSAQAQLKHQKKMAWSQYLLGKDYSTQQYDLQRTEAQSQSYIAENRLNQNLDSSMQEVNTGLLAQAYGTQNAQIQTASNIGNLNAAEGASGTRGNNAWGLMGAYEQASLDRSLDIQNQQNSQMLSGISTQATNALTDIRRERESWEEGGYRYEQQKAQDSYNQQMAELGQSNFDWQISDAAPTGMDYLTGMFGGMSSGINFANSSNNFLNTFFDLGGKP